MESDEKMFANLVKTVERIDASLHEMQTNHLFHIEKSIGDLRGDYKELKADYGWVKWGVLALLGGIITVYFKV